MLGTRRRRIDELAHLLTRVEEVARLSTRAEAINPRCLQVFIDCSEENVSKLKLREWAFDGEITGDQISAGDGRRRNGPFNELSRFLTAVPRRASSLLAQLLSGVGRRTAGGKDSTRLGDGIHEGRWNAPEKAWCWHEPIHAMWQIAICSCSTREGSNTQNSDGQREAMVERG